MNTSLLLAYLATVTVLEVIPGPDMLYCLATGLRAGPRGGFLAALGTATGEVVHITAAAIGLSAIFRAVPALFEAMRFGGAAYLVLLGIRVVRSRDGDLAGGGGAGRRPYLRGLVTNLLNPKMALFSLVLLAQFVDPRAGNVALQYVVLGACFVALEIAIDGTVGLLAGRLNDRLRGTRLCRHMNVGSGSVLVGLGLSLALHH